MRGERLGVVSDALSHFGGLEAKSMQLGAQRSGFDAGRAPTDAVVQSTLTLGCLGLPPARHVVPHICDAFSEVGVSIPFVGDSIPFVGHSVPLVGRPAVATALGVAQAAGPSKGGLGSTSPGS